MRVLRRLIAAGATLFVLSVIGAGPAQAGTCYTVYVDGQAVTICPWD
jgi:hypothetical protein